MLARVAALVVLVAVMALSTLAKNTDYLPDSNPAHYLSSASKMRLVHSPVIQDRTPSHPISKTIPQKQISKETHRNDPGLPSIQKIIFICSFQYRSPPPILA